MALIEDGEKGRPLELPCPARKSSFAIWRYDRCPPFGRLRRSRFASATTWGRSSAWFFRPSTFAPPSLRVRVAPSLRLRSRAPLSFATVMALSNSETAPRTCRMSRAVGVRVQEVGYAMLTQRRIELIAADSPQSFSECPFGPFSILRLGSGGRAHLTL